jgi:hypothetical protein
MAKLIVLAVGMSLVGCGGANADQKIIQNASNHWECPAEKIHVEKVDGETYRVEGCDHEAAYACRNSSDCTKVSGF